MLDELLDNKVVLGHALRHVLHPDWRIRKHHLHAGTRSTASRHRIEPLEDLTVTPYVFQHKSFVDLRVVLFLFLNRNLCIIS